MSSVTCQRKLVAGEAGHCRYDSGARLVRHQSQGELIAPEIALRALIRLRLHRPCSLRTTTRSNISSHSLGIHLDFASTKSVASDRH